MRPRLIVLPLLAVIGLAAVLSFANLPLGKKELRWKEMNEGLPRYGITTAVAFDAVNDDLVYAAVYYRRAIYRSEDGGQTWQQADEGLGGAPVYALAADPVRPMTVYAGASDGLYVSTDAAHSWRQLPLPEKPIYALLVPRKAPDRIYAGSFAQLYVSHDRGESWTTLADGLQGVTLLSFAAGDEAAETFYAGTSGGGLLHTRDGGKSWSQMFGGEAVISSIAIRARDGLVFARAENRLMRGKDGLEGWEPVEALPGGRRPLSIMALPTDDETILAGAEGAGVFLTSDAGMSWRQLGEELGRGRVTALAASRNNPLRLVAGTVHGVYLSHDGGLSWKRGEGIGRPIVRGLALDAAGGRLLAGTSDGIFERTAAAWSSLGPMPEETLVLSVAAVPGKPETLFAGTWGAAVQKSIDGGRTWHLSAGGHYSQTIIPALLTDPAHPDRIYARVEYARLIASDDGGATWRSLDAGLLDTTVFSLAMAPATPGLLYAGTDKGIYRSADRGARWFSTGKFPWKGSVFAVAVDPIDSAQLTVGTTSGVFYSKDDGRTWDQAEGTENVTVSSLVFSDGNRKHGFAGTRFDGVYRTDDGGLSWRPWGGGLAGVTVNALVLDEKAKLLVAGTEEGVYALPLTAN